MGAFLKIIRPDTGSTSTGTNGIGESTSVTDAYNHTTTYVYDGTGRLINEYPLRAVEPSPTHTGVSISFPQ